MQDRDCASQRLLHRRQRAAQVRLDDAERQPGLGRDLGLRASAHEGQRNASPPQRVERPSAISNCAASCASLAIRAGSASAQANASRALSSKSTLAQSGLRPSARNASSPRERAIRSTHVHAPTAGVEVQRLTPDLPEHVFHHLFGGRVIVRQAKRAAADAAGELAVQLGKRGLVLVDRTSAASAASSSSTRAPFTAGAAGVRAPPRFEVGQRAASAAASAASQRGSGPAVPGNVASIIAPQASMVNAPRRRVRAGAIGIGGASVRVRHVP